MNEIEKNNIIDGIFEKVIQTTIQPIITIPSCNWDGWEDFLIENRVREKFAKVITNMLIMNHSSLILLDGNVIVPTVTSQIETDISQIELARAKFVVANRNSLIYNASTDTEALFFDKKKGKIKVTKYPIPVNEIDINPKEKVKGIVTTMESKFKTIPVVWFARFVDNRTLAMINSTKKVAGDVLDQIIAQLDIAGPNIMFLGSANNVTKSATQMKNAILDSRTRVHKINESLNKTVSNPIISFNNQPYFQQFWDLIDSMVNSLIEGLQVGDMNQGGKGTANMHTTEVMGSFGVKMQKIKNIQNMFISSWHLMIKILKESGIEIPEKIEFNYESIDNALQSSMEQKEVNNENKQ